MAILNHSHGEFVFDWVTCQPVDVVVLHDEGLNFLVVDISSPNDKEISVSVANPSLGPIELVLSGVDLFGVGLQVGGVRTNLIFSQSPSSDHFERF